MSSNTSFTRKIVGLIDNLMPGSSGKLTYKGIDLSKNSINGKSKYTIDYHSDRFEIYKGPSNTITLASGYLDDLARLWDMLNEE